MNTVLASLITLVVGGVLTYVTTRRKLAFDYDADLREKRTVAYKDLWRRLEPLAKYGSTRSFSKADAEQLAASLRTGYFARGGLFLSTATREDHFAVQDVVAHLEGGWGWTTPACEELTDEAREVLRVSGSRLRSSLSRDVGTRRQPKLRGDIEPVARTSAGVYERDDGSGTALELRFRPRVLGGTLRRPLLTPRWTEDEIDVKDWSRARRTIRAVLPKPVGDHRERVLVMEPGKLVEGPPLDQENPASAAL